MPQDKGYPKVDLSKAKGPMHKSKKLKQHKKSEKRKYQKNKGGVHRKGGY